MKQGFIVFLSFSESLATKVLFLNEELCMIRPTLIDLNLGLSFIIIHSLLVLMNVLEVIIPYLQKCVL